MKHFQRAESAAFFGREIALMYTHAHLRYAEALARFVTPRVFSTPFARLIRSAFAIWCLAQPFARPTATIPALMRLFRTATRPSQSTRVSKKGSAPRWRLEGLFERAGHLDTTTDPGFLGWRTEHSALVLDR